MPFLVGQSSKAATESVANRQFWAQQAAPASVAMVMSEASRGRQITTVFKWEFLQSASNKTCLRVLACLNETDGGFGYISFIFGSACRIKKVSFRHFLSGGLCGL